MKEFAITELWGRSHPLVELPPLWGVIYYEGIHGNHILFTQDEVETFESQAALEAGPVEPSWLAEVGYLMTKYPTYRDIVNYLASLTRSQRQQIYVLYKVWLGKMGLFLKTNAH